MATATKAVEAAEIVEDVKEVAEDVVDIVEESASWMSSNPKVLVAIASLTGVAVGGALTYLIVSKKLSSKWQAIADEQIESVKATMVITQKPDLASLALRYEGEDTEVESAVKDLITREGYSSYDKVADAIEQAEESSVDEAVVDDIPDDVNVLPRDRNIWESDDPTRYFDFDEELRRRADKPDRPFVITKDEFDESEYEQQVLTYYDGDEVLVDEYDSPIIEDDAVVGAENLLRFGHGSGDPAIVYVRNNKLGADFEINFRDAKFAREVLGYDDELQHSDRRTRKFRPIDE